MQNLTKMFIAEYVNIWDMEEIEIPIFAMNEKEAFSLARMEMDSDEWELIQVLDEEEF